MPIEKFTSFRSSAVPIRSENIDTDQIIPARFLKATSREGFGENLFRDWRYDSNGNLIPGFPLNDEKYAGKVLLGGSNFGCGSSREHAAWAIYDYGFRVVISSFFADIFKNNSLNIGLLPITIKAEEIKQLFEATEKNPKTEYVIDLKNQNLKVPEIGFETTFEIHNYRKECLLNGLDNIDYILKNIEKVRRYEAQRKYT